MDSAIFEHRAHPTVMLLTLKANVANKWQKSVSPKMINCSIYVDCYDGGHFGWLDFFFISFFFITDPPPEVLKTVVETGSDGDMNTFPFWAVLLNKYLF